MIRIEDCLTPFEDAQILDALDVELARGFLRMVGQTPDAQPEVALGAALASRAPAHGHLCVQIQTAANTPCGSADMELPDDTMRPILPWPRPDAWLKALNASTLVRGPASDQVTPLVLDVSGRLYLDRYWCYEQRLADGIRDRLGGMSDIEDPAALAQVLERLIPENPDKPDWRRGVLDQRFAVLVALRHKFAVLSGGPGTGKTTSVGAILMSLLWEADQARRRGSDHPVPRIQLMAPTGKAAARMTEAIRAFRERLAQQPASSDLADLLPAEPWEASTIHRALKIHPDRPTHPAFCPDHRLPADIVVVDEASMVDAAMMTRLIDALRPDARLVLLGDQDQLASVEAGAILGDLCGVGGDGPSGVSPVLADLAHQVVGPDLELTHSPTGPAIRDAVAHLSHPFRFGETSGIGRLSRSIRELASQTGEVLERAVGLMVERVIAAQGVDGGQDLLWHPLDGADDLEGRTLAHPDDPASRQRAGVVRREIEQHWGGILRRALGGFAGVTDQAGHLDAVRQALLALDDFRVLCTHRRGPRGVETLNRLTKKWLKDIADVRGDWFEGCPIMVLKNDYRTNLFNGDVGMVLKAAPGDGPGLRAWFQGPNNTPRSLVEARLPAHETVFAMTIHKSQGSQFDHVLLLLPARDSEFVTRELVYTGLTRAKERAHLAGSADVLRASLKRRVQRASGLRERLWG